MGDDFILLSLQNLKHASLLHEINRQNIMNVGIMSSLKPLLKTQNPDVSKPWTFLFRFVFSPHLDVLYLILYSQIEWNRY